MMINLYFGTNKSSFVTMLMVSSGQRIKVKFLTCRLEVLCILMIPFIHPTKAAIFWVHSPFLVIQVHALCNLSAVAVSSCYLMKCSRTDSLLWPNSPWDHWDVANSLWSVVISPVVGHKVFNQTRSSVLFLHFLCLPSLLSLCMCLYHLKFHWIWNHGPASDSRAGKQF